MFGGVNRWEVRASGLRQQQPVQQQEKGRTHVGRGGGWRTRSVGRTTIMAGNAVGGVAPWTWGGSKSAREQEIQEGNRSYSNGKGQQSKGAQGQSRNDRANTLHGTRPHCGPQEVGGPQHGNFGKVGEALNFHSGPPPGWGAGGGGGWGRSRGVGKGNEGRGAGGV